MGKGQAERLMPLIAEVAGGRGGDTRRSRRHRRGRWPGQFHRYPHCRVGGARAGAGARDPGGGRRHAGGGGPWPAATTDRDRRRAAGARCTCRSSTTPARGDPLLLDIGDLPHVVASRRVTGSGAALAVEALPEFSVLPPAQPLAEAIARIAATRYRDPALPRARAALPSRRRCRPLAVTAVRRSCRHDARAHGQKSTRRPSAGRGEIWTEAEIATLRERPTTDFVATGDEGFVLLQIRSARGRDPDAGRRPGRPGTGPGGAC